MKLTSLASWSITFTSILASIPLANAAFSINYSVETSFPAPPSSLFGPKGDIPGAEYYNQVTAPGFANLRDIFTVPTGVSLAITTSSSYVVGQVGADSPMPLLKNSARDSASGNSNFITMTLTGLSPGDRYTVWVASGNPSNPTVGSWKTSNSTSTLGAQPINNTSLINPGAAWIQGNDFVLFNNVIVDGLGQLMVTGTGDDRALRLSGFQIAPVVPEPATALLSALGALALLRRRR